MKIKLTKAGKLSKSARLFLYKQALKVQKEFPDYLCLNLSNRLFEASQKGKRVKIGPYNSDFQKLFPEFFDCKPKVTYSGSVWFSLGKKGDLERLKVLRKCIKMCSKK